MLVFGQIALAADMPVKAPPPPPPPPSWSGFYLGADIGTGWRSADHVTFADVNSPGVIFPTLQSTGSALGAVYGIYAGYNWQFSPIGVFGVEGDINGASIRQLSFATPAFVGGASTTFLSTVENTQWLASIRARLGFVGWNALWYVTGGGAWTESHDTAHGVFNSPFIDNGSVNVNKTGWVAGAGAEYMLTPNVLLRAEYLYYRFDGGASDVAPFVPAFGVPTSPVYTFSGNYNIQVVRVGASYKFNWGY
jgi:outer membrane immunogenic protein